MFEQVFSPIGEKYIQPVVCGPAQSPKICGIISAAGRVSEWFKELVLKTGVPAMVPWVRIPPLPPKHKRYVTIAAEAKMNNLIRFTLIILALVVSLFLILAISGALSSSDLMKNLTKVADYFAVLFVTAGVVMVLTKK